MNHILSRENLILALKRVERNKGSHGVDGMTVKSLRSHVSEHWESLRAQLEAGTYEPSPVRRVEIPKPDGGVWLLGIPTVVDRFIQQAIAQVLSQVYDPIFSEYSYGFRPERNGHQAVRQAKAYIQEGKRWVVDMDLEKFFDKVNHDKLMGLLAKRIQDQALLRIIKRFLKSGIMVEGVCVSSTQGTPRGGPLSPLLVNIILNELDQELERRGQSSVRYADDFHIYVSSKKAGSRVMDSITEWVERKLHLKVNRKKSAVDRPWRRKFLGFSFTSNRAPKVRIHQKSIQRMKDKVRSLTSRKKAWSMEFRLYKLNQFLVGWCGYFALADTPSTFKHLDEWVRRRLRMCLWKEWKQPKTRKRKLIRLGADKWKAHEWANSRKAYWRISGSPILQRTLNNSFWSRLGLRDLFTRYKFLCQS